MRHFCFSVVFLLVASFQTSAQNTSNSSALRIVALSPHTTEMVYELGLGRSLIATVDFADFPEEAQQVPRVGGSYGLSIEKIVSLKPDFVLAWRGGNKAGDIEKLESLGLNIVDSSPTSIDQVASEYRRIGKLLGVTAQANEIANKFEHKLSLIKQQYIGKAQIASFYQMWPEPLMTINNTTWTHRMMALCGAQNVFAEQTANYPQISIENVIVKQPDIIIVPMEKDQSVSPAKHWLKWQQIPAVKEKKFVMADADLLHRFTSRALIGAERLCADIDKYR